MKREELTQEGFSLLTEEETHRPKPPLEIVALDSLPAEQRAQAQKLSNSINPEEPHSLLQYGLPVQSDLSRFSDTILDHIRTKDTGPVGEIISDLMIKLKGIEPEQLDKPKGFLSKLPFFGSAVKSGEKLMASYQKVGQEVDQITDLLDKRRLELFRDLTLLENLFQKNKEYFQSLNVHIAGARYKLDELRQKTIPQMQSKVSKSSDGHAVQELNDLIQFADRLEKKIHDLLLSRTITMQTAPQVRLIQNNNQVLIEKIQSSILTTIPLWKNQLVLTLSLYRQQKALEAQRQVTDTTNELLLRNAEMLRTNSTGVARENERGLVDLDTLKKTQEHLMATLDETLQIQQEGRRQRLEVERELAQMEQELKQKLLSLRD
ncbi:toxic anion resistance protein [Heliorestis acidaminivorans]|uniref:Toxic anion resistance protein n=1 Tax=Heliorestis acidaminivorans TaxID=553427 RepID=A0A6I0EV92_9FIRM|nr:toxic anion resistance protein [Heliorestis acidaminivorans]KAB2951799.1 toxic anion resistance protein [Heliorestis acidaminivorans]